MCIVCDEIFTGKYQSLVHEKKLQACLFYHSNLCPLSRFDQCQEQVQPCSKIVFSKVFVYLKKQATPWRDPFHGAAL